MSFTRPGTATYSKSRCVGPPRPWAPRRVGSGVSNNTAAQTKPIEMRFISSSGNKKAALCAVYDCEGAALSRLFRLRRGHYHDQQLRSISAGAVVLRACILPLLSEAAVFKLAVPI